jgi:hypothetical protein
MPSLIYFVPRSRPTRKYLSKFQYRRTSVSLYKLVLQMRTFKHFMHIQTPVLSLGSFVPTLINRNFYTKPDSYSAGQDIRIFYWGQNNVTMSTTPLS